MLPKNRRIKRQIFSDLLSKGKRFSTAHLLAFLVKKGDKSLSQFAVSVSKKICKKAVDRNKYRRQSYAIISSHIKDISNGFFCLFVFKRGSYPVSFNQLESEIDNILSSFGII